MLLVCLWFCRLLSRSFALVCLSLASLACVLFRRRPTGIGRAGFLYFSGVEKFWPTPLYKASMYIVRAFFFTQQFSLAGEAKEIRARRGCLGR
jgi:hypothetical protein